MRRIISEETTKPKKVKPIEKSKAERKNLSERRKMVIKLGNFGVNLVEIEGLMQKYSLKDLAQAVRYYSNQRKDYEDKAEYVRMVCDRCIEKRKLKEMAKGDL